MKAMLSNAWQYRYFIASSIRNELVAQFVRSKLGGLWMVINPLVMVAIYAFVLSAVLSTKFSGIDNKYAYAIYLTSGILGWTLFNDVMTRCLNLFTENANLMKKMAVPKVALPLIVAGTCLVNNFMLFIVSMVVFWLLGYSPSVFMLWLPLLTLALTTFAMGIGLIVGTLNVFIRDFNQLVPIVLQFLFWFTPIVYPASIIPAELTQYLALNPMHAVVTAYHDVLAFQQMPNLSSVFCIFMLGLALLAVGLFLIRKSSSEMVDAL